MSSLHVSKAISKYVSQHMKNCQNTKIIIFNVRVRIFENSFLNKIRNLNTKFRFDRFFEYADLMVSE